MLLLFRAVISVLPCVNRHCILYLRSHTKALESPKVIYFDDFKFNLTITSRFYSSALGSDGTFLVPQQRRKKNSRENLKNLFSSLFFRKICNYIYEIKMLRLWVDRNRYGTRNAGWQQKHIRQLNSFRAHGRRDHIMKLGSISFYWNELMVRQRAGLQLAAVGGVVVVCRPRFSGGHCLISQMRFSRTTIWASDWLRLTMNSHSYALTSI